MYFDRIALKRTTKRLVTQGNPAVYLVTLVFLLATTWVTSISGLAVASPLNGIVEVMESWSVTMMESEYISESAMDAMMQQLGAAMTGPQVMIGLLVSLIVSLYSMVVSIGYYGYTLRIMRGEEGGFGDLFSCFYMAGKIIWLQILKLIFIYLWTLLFFFPGIIANYRYRMAEYCLLDDPDISALEAIRRSKKLMQGKKFDLFATEFSFIGWILLDVLIVEAVYSVGMMIIPNDVVIEILVLIADTAFCMWLVGYQSLTIAGFYLFVRGNQDQAPPVAPPTIDSNGQPQNPFGEGSTDNPWRIGGGDDEGWNK